ncbi:MAG: VOC family protein [Acidimicrobiia bacterium]
MGASFQIVIDCADPARLAGFWAVALGYIVQPPPAGHDSWESFLTSMGVPPSEFNRASALVDPDGRTPRIFFQRVPEPKTVKNRLHLDVNVGGGPGVPLGRRQTRVDAEVQRLQGHGATVIGPIHEGDEYWVVMADPEGNEFCVQ